ncbi:hypothetical protein ACQY0O_004920 [Thecaphora frezii]
MSHPDRMAAHLARLPRRLTSPPPVVGPSILSCPTIGAVAGLVPRPRTANRASPRTLIPLRLSSTIRDSHLPPLLRLRGAWLPNVSDADASGRTASGAALDWTINDAGDQECWAIIGPASEQGGRARREIVDVILGRARPKQTLHSSTEAPAPGPEAHSLSYHPSVHPFLQAEDGVDAGRLRKLPSDAIKHVSFATQMGGRGSSGEFTNYSARYGAIRDEDRVTLYERLMELLQVPVGLVAAQKMLPDPLIEATEATQDVVGLFKWPSEQARTSARERALRADATIRTMAPLLLIDDELLHRPVIALSNGQTRRARILSSLISGAEVVVLEEPYSGIDVGTRQALSRLFGRLHAERRPRFVLVLREQDEVPDLVTHIVRLNEAGAVTQKGPRSRPSAVAASAETSDATDARQRQRHGGKGGYDVVKRNAADGIGRGRPGQPPVVSMNKVSVVYGEKRVLDSIDLQILPGDRLVLAGDNGSGKTTLLALMLGDHARSFSFSRDELSLFGMARDEPRNARPLLGKRIGHLSPELFNAFPRKSAERGGLTVGEVVASGYGNVFARRSYNEAQKRRVWGLLRHFADVIRSPDGRTLTAAQSGELTGEQTGDEEVRDISQRGFTELSYGSQAIVLLLRAVVGQPELVVLDEPFQGMDARQVERVRDYLDESALPWNEQRWVVGDTEQEKQADAEAKRRMAVVLVSHYESEWPTQFGRLVRLSDGVVVERL